MPYDMKCHQQCQYWYQKNRTEQTEVSNFKVDTSIWWNGSCFQYEFYEKPTVPNRVLQRDTALDEATNRSSLNQEVVRRMLNCSLDLDVSRKREFLSVFSQKLVNSGFS